MTRLLLAVLLLAGCAPASRAALQADPSSLPAGTTTDAGTVPSPDFAGQRGQPDPKAVIPAPTVQDSEPSPGRITPSPTATGSSPEPVRKPRTATILRGIATWFDSPAGVSAAGPDLRAALGPGWRGTTVTVCAGDRCVVTVLGDWCGCGPRPGGPTVIDLHAPLFARLSPLSRGVVRVSLSW